MNCEPCILPGERLDDLQYHGLRLIQHPRGFCFGTDAVLLAHFATLRPGWRMLDLCSGSGVIPLLMTARVQNTTATAVELQPTLADRARRSMLLNDMTTRITVRCIDALDLIDDPSVRQMNLITCNPPYQPRETREYSPNPERRLARQESSCTLADFIRIGTLMLNNQGRFALVHQAHRLDEILSIMQSHNLQPKRLRLVQPREDKPANLVLIEAIKAGKPGLHLLPTLSVYDTMGRYTPAMRAMYEGGTI